ncbi:hypothetical protein A1O3_07007 [Capronia epimyces CBS 606.96]|uniref:Uncharacterized protein n=1 Tax=Capronia epimyces CBS 606.96 TaxID=1182542 RepID=W9XKH5_9EURO|nr:uncharacterized protein A1O3_07007 [Capronia epimyces CBS 606.96]EXJ80723.1 hypothetical protein A1O3_07007 [Capronia epimyces CBS 606.96]
MSADEQWPIPVEAGIDAASGEWEGKQWQDQRFPDMADGDTTRPATRRPSTPVWPHGKIDAPSGDNTTKRPSWGAYDVNPRIRQPAEAPIAVDTDDWPKSRRPKTYARSSDDASEQATRGVQHITEYHYHIHKHKHKHVHEQARSSKTTSPRSTTFNTGGADHGSPPPPQSYSIGMNTDMNTNVDPMVSIPLPRIRPRAMTRPPMPIRAEAMYGLPKLAPHHNRANTTGIEYPPTWPDGRLQPTARLDPRGSELDLVPPPLRPRQPSHDLARPKEVPTKSELTMEGLGLMRKCSRCHHGFVDAKLRGTDSVTPTSDPQREGVEAAEGSKVLHPAGSPLPGVPEDIGENDVVQSKTSSPAPKADVVVDERDHSICCPDCCKDEDCHEGCLGHPSPTPASSPTKSIWSEAQTSSSASDVDDWDNTDDTEGSEKGRSSPFAFVKAALKRSRKKKSQSSLGINASPFELSAHPRTPVTGSREDSARNANDALSAALSATGSPNPMISGRRTRQRQRSSSVPSIGVGVPGSKSDGSRLRVPTPAGLAIACSGAPKSQSRSVSGTSVATFELQVPGFGSLGGSAIGDMVLVPFEASKMWIRNHPQAMTLGWDVLERGWQMGRTMTATGWRIWAVVFVYSKTGKLKLKLAKGETAGGFVIDCARSLVYLMIFAAVGVFVMRVMRVVFGMASLVGWLFHAVFWLLKQVLGFGLAR